MVFDCKGACKACLQQAMVRIQLFNFPPCSRSFPGQRSLNSVQSPTLPLCRILCRPITGTAETRLCPEMRFLIAADDSSGRGALTLLRCDFIVPVTARVVVGWWLPVAMRGSGRRAGCMTTRDEMHRPFSRRV